MGLYDVVWTAIIFGELFLGFKLADACYRYSLKNKNIEYYFSIGFLLILVISLLALLSIVISLMFYSYEYPYLITVSLLVIISKLFITLYLEFLRAKERFKKYRRSGMFLATGYILSCFGQVYLYPGFDVISFFVGLLLVNFLYLIGNILCFYNTSFLIINKEDMNKELKQILIFGLTLQPSALSWWFLRFSQRWIVLLYFGLEAVAMVSVSSYPFLVFSALSTYMYMAAQRAMFKVHDEGQEGIGAPASQYRVIRSIYLALSVAIFIGIDALSVFIFPDELFNRVVALTCLYGGLFLAIGSYFGNVYMAQLRVGAASVTAILSAVLGALFTIMALYLFGVNGFAIGVLAGGVTLFLLRLLDPHIYKIFVDARLDLIFYLLVTISFLVQLEMPIIVQTIYFLVLSCVLGLIMARDQYCRSKIKKVLTFLSKGVRGGEN